MGVFNELGKALQVETRRLDHIAVIDRVANETRKAVPQYIKVACGPLDVCECGWIAPLQKIKPLTTHHYVLEIPEQFLIVLLADTVEIHNLTVEIIQNFDF